MALAGAMRRFAVINPASGGRRTGAMMGQIGAALEGTLGSIYAARTEGPGDATRLVARALDEGYRHIVAIGGDGTLNEAVNGFFRDGAPIAPDAVFSFAMSGSGATFAAPSPSRVICSRPYAPSALRERARSTSAALPSRTRKANRRRGCSSTSPASACPATSSSASTARGLPSGSADPSPSSGTARWRPSG